MNSPLSQSLNQAAVRTKEGEHAKALALLRRLLLVHPDRTEVLAQAGTSALQNGEMALALTLLQRWPDLEPTNGRAWIALALALFAEGRIEDAESLFLRAGILLPESAETDFYRGMCRLTLGDYQRGWPLYERRREAYPQRHLQLAAPRWQGEPLDGRILLVAGEQGFGDMLQFARFLPRLRDEAIQNTGRSRVVFVCPDGLLPLFAPLVPGEILPASRREPVSFDCFTTLVGLANALKVTASDISAAPYLTADPAFSQIWRQRLRAEAGLKIGICWCGSASHSLDWSRSFDPEWFGSLSRLPGVKLYSLQKEPSRPLLPGCEEILAADLAPDLTDFSQTAAAMSALDLIITADTSVAHLAGALGRPVWIALPRFADWRWGREGESSCWYQSARLFRQSQHGEWGDVFARMEQELASWTS